MITAELPFSGDSVHTIIYKHIYEEPPLASAKRPGIPGSLTVAVSRALAKEPDQRFPTMEEFATAVWPEQPVAAPAKSRAPLGRAPGRRPMRLRRSRARPRHRSHPRNRASRLLPRGAGRGLPR